MVKRIETSKPFPNKLLQKGVEPLDVDVLREALKGNNYKTIAEKLNINERTVRSRLEKLENKEIIEKDRQQVPLLDTVALWEYVFVTFLKLHLPSAVPPSSASATGGIGQIASTPAPIGWYGALEELRRDNELYDKLVRCAFIVIGTEYDAILVITTQSKDEYGEFCTQLQRKGIIEKIWGSMAVEWAGYTWNPIAVPDAAEARESMKYARDALMHLSIK